MMLAVQRRWKVKEVKPKIANFPVEKRDGQPKGSVLMKQKEQRLGEQRRREAERKGQRSRGGGEKWKGENKMDECVERCQERE